MASRADKMSEVYLHSSFTRKNQKFVTDKQYISWYSCGPTVYDESHMGHARCYVSLDILRRVMQDYFGYRILYAMNITDVDDKIIKRARTHHLLEQYKLSDLNEERLVDDLMSSCKYLENQLETIEEPEKKKMINKEIEKAKKAITDLKSTQDLGNGDQRKSVMKKLIESAQGPLGEWLDSVKGSTVTDNSIFTTLPRHFENEFHNDMKELNVLRADVVTKVSDYINEIIDFVKGIINNGFAYESNGSVYFDVAKFDQDPKHSYAKLVREAYGNHSALQEGEGALSAATPTEKRSLNDFALWKTSKPGEPSWESPWGLGRPGWHIECSAMAGAIFGESLDIHAGGVDLKFPHHDNEIAQSEAFYQTNQWCKYFLHSGHLHIDGCKMSKSLKNFITIKDALKSYSAAELRVVFLLHSWKDTLDYSSNTMECAKQYLKMLSEFRLNVTDVVRRLGDTDVVWSANERSLYDAFCKAEDGVHERLCDNIDTRGSLDQIRELVTQSNKYMQNSKEVNSQLLYKIRNYIDHMFRVFGVPSDKVSSDSSSNDGKLSLAEVVADIREEDRLLAKDKELEASGLRQKLLTRADKLRDEILPRLGVRLEDRDQGSPTIKLVDPDQLLKELAEKKAQEAAKKAEKEKKKAEAAAKKEEAMKTLVEPSLLFKTKEYSAWDSAGIPTHDAEGKEITKSQLKKLNKNMEAHKKKYEKLKQSA